MATDIDYKEKFIRSLAPDSLITIVPDGTTKTFSVSKAIFCDTSDFFVKALDGNFKEAHDSTLRFPGFNVDVIEWFIFWAHKRYLPDLPAHIDSIADFREKPAVRDKVQPILISLWVFADAHLIPKLQNEVMRQLVALTASWHTPASVIRQGYEIAPQGSPLSKFIIDEARYMYFSTPAFYGVEEHDLENLAHLPGFMADFLGPVRNRLLEEEQDVQLGCYKSAHTIGTEQYMMKED